MTVLLAPPNSATEGSRSKEASKIGALFGADISDTAVD